MSRRTRDYRVATIYCSSQGDVMKTLQTLALASILSMGALSTAHAQVANQCPTLPAGSGLSWERLEGADFTFCKAMRDADGTQAFAVTISSESPFKPRRGDRVAETVIDGRASHWYRSEVAGAAALQVRETLLELDRSHVAHITLRARSDQELAASIDVVEALRFDGTRFSSN